MKRLVMTVVAAGAAVAAVAMPTKAELQKAQAMVNDVTASDMAALKAKTKKPAEVAAKHMELAGQASSEAEKYLLLQGAFRLFVKGEDYENAAKAIETMQAEIKDFNPEVIVELCGKALVRKMRENAPRLYALKENARRIVFYRRQLPIREAAVRKNPRDPQVQRKLAECHAELGDWPKALEVFAKAGGEFKKMSEGEASGKVPAQELGDFWWGYETKSDTLVYKLHAAELYRKAIADDSFKGLARTRAEQRVKEVEGDTAIVAAAGHGTGPRAPAATGLYCVIDLSGGPDAKKYPVSYLNDMPKGGWSDEYKTTKLVLRRIEPGSFMMGAGNGRHQEKVDKPFYLGVFEVTQKQWELVMGTRPSYFGGPSWRVRPVDQIPYDAIRGKQEGSKWPGSDAVDGDSFLGILRQKTGQRFDLPMQEQWEYACRAGAETDFYNGKACINDEHDSSLDGLARYAHTGGWNESWGANNNKSRWEGFWKAPDRNCETTSGTAAVGAYQPNRWGLYDMLGNVREWCLQKDERGMNLGGCWIDGADACKVYSVNRIAKNRGRHDFGFRLCLPLAGGAAAQASAATTTTGSIELKTGGDSPFTVKGNEATLELKNGAKLEFVKCPSGWVKVVDDYQKKTTRRVKITRPFWIMKRLLSKNDVRGTGDLEKSRPCQDTGFIEPSMAILEGYCAELSDSLKSALPPGYVVRVPSIAEWEYAYHAGSDDPDDQPFGTLLRSYWGVFKHGAESPKNRWGLCEFHDVEKVLDRIDRKDLQPFGKEEKRVARLPPSNEREDLFYWTSDLTAAPYLSRWPVGERLWMEPAHDHLAPVRLVIGPDLVSEWKAKHKK